MKTCSCSGNDNDIIKWETAESSYGRRSGHTFMYICTVCGHTAWPDTGHADAEDRASSPSDDNTAL
jgi:hypothetical protein